MRSTIALAWRCRPAPSNPAVPGLQGETQVEVLDGHLAAVMLLPPSSKIYLKTTQPNAARWSNGAFRKVSHAWGSSGEKLEEWDAGIWPWPRLRGWGVAGREGLLDDLAPVRALSAMGVAGLDFAGEREFRILRDSGVALRAGGDGQGCGEEESPCPASMAVLDVLLFLEEANSALESASCCRRRLALHREPFLDRAHLRLLLLFPFNGQTEVPAPDPHLTPCPDLPPSPISSPQQRAT